MLRVGGEPRKTVGPTLRGAASSRTLQEGLVSRAVRKLFERVSDFDGNVALPSRFSSCCMSESELLLDTVLTCVVEVKYVVVLVRGGGRALLSHAWIGMSLKGVHTSWQECICGQRNRDLHDLPQDGRSGESDPTDSVVGVPGERRRMLDVCTLRYQAYMSAYSALDHLTKSALFLLWRGDAVLECPASLCANLLLSALQQMQERKESQQQHSVEEYIAPVLKCSHDQRSVLEFIAPAPGVCAAPALCREVITPAPGSVHSTSTPSWSTLRLR